MCDTDYSHHSGHGGDLPAAFGIAGAFFLGLLAIIKAAWWLTSRIAAPLVAVLAVAAWRWSTGALMLPDRPRATPPLFNRRVRAAGRNLLTALIVGTLVNPLATAVVTVTVVAAGIATVVTVRTRAARRHRPRRVRVAQGVPVRSPNMRGPNMRRPMAQPAITDAREDLTWTEQTVRDAAGRAA
jgi:hypothetical protein